ncbi:heterokaryon incompatibility protein-domain-containing protein [Massariosphaeria phaeospora]|uniref:Heterokaryon incompatibility protein-domain-containing protein n=1 Tax=Massariosphaeria phaeospora TaxID=100035 RepID=A0A7C8I2K9_9PLEO|nr:heterokaryon incompatibility protein-domain-containing protein [Massariosphaeria phaeospora]
MITRKLGVRYLWIDSLCIIQDCTSDWEKESPKMCDIYQNALFTISATHATDSTEGCFRPREGNVVRPTELSINVSFWDTSKKTVFLYFAPLHDYFGIGEGESDFEEKAKPLESRAWVLQESVLSRRTLSYTGNGLEWACQQSHCAETWPDRTARSNFKHHATRFASGRKHPAGKDTRTTHLERWNEWEAWQNLLYDYTSRKLTYSKDRLAAIRGVAEAYRQALGITYLAGLWKEFLIYDLCWKAEGLGTGNIDHNPYRDEFPLAPSWSWASTNGVIKNNVAMVHRISRARVPPIPLAILRHVDLEAVSASQLGSIVITGYTRDVKITTSGFSFYLYDLEDRYLEASLNLDQELPLPCQMTFLLLVNSYPAQLPHTHAGGMALLCMAIMPCAETGYYKRVGMARMGVNDWLSNKDAGGVWPASWAGRRANSFARWQVRRGIRPRLHWENFVQAGWGTDVPRLSPEQMAPGKIHWETVTIV